MSADLLIEFGTPTTPISEDRTPNVRPSSVIDIFDFPPGPASESKTTPSRTTREVDGDLWNQNLGRTNVIFDASEEEDADDDFGDFETVEEAQSANPMNSWSMLTPPALSTTSTSQVDRGLTTLLDDADWGAFEDVSQAMAPTTVEPVIKDSEDNEGDNWVVFEEVVESAMDRSQEVSRRTSESSKKDLPTSRTVLHRTIKPTDKTVRPTNIPPPALLLQMLPGVFDRLRDAAEHSSLSGQELALLIVQVFVAAARIIFGRSLRWKRDTMLAQGTKIGPAVSCKTRGMKLALIDKSESLKEEREASDAISSWSRHAHFFNAMLVKGDLRRPLMSLSIQATPRAVRQNGILSATHACALCGLRRDERLSGVDLDISDLFGEFWVEYWGHKDCEFFWDTYKDLLPRR